ncbi:MAG: porin [Rhizobiaceae bacterium]
MSNAQNDSNLLYPHKTKDDFMLNRPYLLATLLGGTIFGAMGASAQVVDIEKGGFKFSISGQINQGILYTDDGEETNSFFVDNDNSSTRARAKISYDFGKFLIGGEIEYEFELSSSAVVNQSNTHESRSLANERKFEIFTEGSFGKFSVGQGDSASNGASEDDLSGTTVVGYSGIADLAGGILFRDGSGTLTSTNVGSRFSNLDGNSRIERVRYDTPNFGGFVVSASVGHDDREDLAVRYGKTYGDIEVRSAIAYSANDSRERYHGSISGLHKPSGYSLTFATGIEDQDTGSRDTSFGYVKVGYQIDDLLPYGTTAFSIDYYDGQDIGVDGDDSESFGIQVVQKVDRYNSEVYIGYRNYSYSAPGSTFQDVDAILAGVRFKF